MAESTVRIGLYAADKASPTIKSVQGSIQKLQMDAKSSILAGIGLGAGVTAFNLLGRAVGSTVDAMGDMVQAAVDDETSVRRLNAALQANIPGWNGNTEAIEETIKASERLGFTDDQTRDSLAFLAAATHDVTRAQELHAAAMDLARFKNIDLRTASEALVRIEGGRFRLLASLGIKLKENATATDALAAVQAVAAGQAEEFGDTTAGAMLGAQIAMEEAGEELGRVLAPALKDIAEFVRDVVAPAIEDFGESWDGVGAGIRQFNVDLYNATGGLLGFSQAVADDKDQADQFLANLDAIGDAATAAADDTLAAGQEMGDNIVGPLEDARKEARLVAGIIPSEVAKAMIDGQKEVESGMALLKDLMTDEWDDAARIAYLKGVLSSEQLAEGLRSEEADVRSTAIGIKNSALRELQRLESGAYDAGARATGLNGYSGGIRSGKKPTEDAAGSLQSGARSRLGFNAYGIGSGVASSYAAGLSATTSITAVKAAAYALSLPVMKVLAMAGSPDYTHSREIGERVGETWGEGLRSALVNFTMPRLDASLPNAAGFGMTTAAAAGGVGPIELAVYLDGEQITAHVERRQYYARSTTATYPRG